MSGEAPAEFALIDEFAETPQKPPSNTPSRSRRSNPTGHQQCRPESPSVEAEQAETPADVIMSETMTSETAAPETVAPEIAVHHHEPSPYVEAVADEPASPAAEAPPAAQETPNPMPSTRGHASAHHNVAMARRTVADIHAGIRCASCGRWIADGRFSLGSDEFTRLIGAHTAAGFGRPWSEIAETFGLDPEGRVVKAVATRDTWSGITLNWPVDGGGRLPVELSGLPIYDRAGNFAGYRGFGVCRDLDGLARLAALRRHELFSDPPAPHTASADPVAADGAQDLPVQGSPAPDSPAEAASAPESQDS